MAGTLLLVLKQNVFWIFFTNCCNCNLHVKLVLQCKNRLVSFKKIPKFTIDFCFPIQGSTALVMPARPIRSSETSSATTLRTIPPGTSSHWKTIRGRRSTKKVYKNDFILKGFFLANIAMFVLVSRDSSVGKMVANTLFAVWAGYEAKKTTHFYTTKSISHKKRNDFIIKIRNFSGLPVGAQVPLPHPGGDTGRPQPGGEDLSQAVPGQGQVVPRRVMPRVKGKKHNTSSRT